MAAVLNATTSNNGKLPWTKPVVGKLTLAEAIAEGLITPQEVHDLQAAGPSTDPMVRLKPANDPLAGLTPWQIFHDCIWISDENTYTKIMLLCIARFMDKDLHGSSMSYAQIAAACGFSESTAKRCAKAVRDRWLRIGVGKGRYVPGKGCENLYQGVIPPEVVAELRRRKLKGEATPVDEGLKGAAETIVASMTGVSAGHPDHSNGVSGGDPDADFGVSDRHRGIPQTQAGYPTDTLTPYTPQEEEEDIDADAPPPAAAGCRPIDADSSAAPAFSPQEQPARSALNAEAGANPVNGSAAAPSDFDRFWEVFPPGRRQAKGETRDLFNKIVAGMHKNKARRASAAELIAAAERYAATKPDPQYTPAPTTWLNQGRWEDDVGKPRPNKPLSRY
jgi:hypothetical protein